MLIALYDRIIERRAEDELTARRLVAMRRLATLLQGHTRGVLFSMYRGAVEARPPEAAWTSRDFVEKHLAAQLPHLNVLAPSDAGFPSSPTYAEWISQNCNIFAERLDSWIAAYAGTASSESVGLVESVLAADFLKLGSHLDRVMTAMKEAPFFPPALNCFSLDMADDYCRRLTTLISDVESNLGAVIGLIEDSAWHNEFYAVGHARGSFHPMAPTSG